MSNEVNINLFEKGREYARNCAPDSPYLYRVAAGSTGSTKTQTVLRIKMLQQLKYPGIKSVCIRKKSSTLRSTTIPSFLKAVYEANLQGLMKFNRQDQIATWENGSQYLFKHADSSKDPDYNDIRGLEVTNANIEEGNEVDRKLFNILKTRVGRWKNQEFKLPPTIDITLNPTDCWIKEDFYDPWREKKLEAPNFFMEFTVLDNPILSGDPGFMAGLRSMPEAEYKRFVENNWDYNTDPNQLISYEWLKQIEVDQPEAIDFESFQEQGRQPFKTLGVDVARYGDDRTVLALFDGLNFYKFKVLKGADLYQVADLVARTMQEEGIGADFVWIDGVGLGAGAVDILHKHGFLVKSFNSGSSPIGKAGFFDFANAKAELNWFLREQIFTQNIRFVNQPFEGEPRTFYQDLRYEMLNIRYVVTNKVLAIESKDEAKKRLGKSPDLADAAVLALCPFIYNRQLDLV